MTVTPVQITPADSVAIDRAATRLREGGLVALPTETVYGLAADAENPAAVARVYAVKGRPADHPLIVHIAAADQLPQWSGRLPGYAWQLAGQLWPGPLTLIVPRSARARDHVTGGQQSVGIRVPDHPVAHAVLAAHGGGLAAPSANRFGRVSPTTAAHVAEELGQRLDPQRDLIIDGGPSAVGVESTIVDCTGGRPVILRPGAVSAELVAQVGGVDVAARSTTTTRAPGSLPSHYAPAADVRVMGADEVPGIAEPGTADPTVGLLATIDIATPRGVVRLAAPPGVAEFAQSLYAALREADSLLLRTVVVVPPEPVHPGEGGLVAAIADRLRRAAIR